MSTSLLNHTQNIRNFHHVSHAYLGGHLTWTIIRAPGKFRCPICQSPRVRPHFKGYRKVAGLPTGRMQTTFQVAIHRLKCQHCGSYKTEELEFTPLRKCHYTKELANKVIELRREMTVSAISKYFGLHWNTVKDIEKKR